MTLKEARKIAWRIADHFWIKYKSVTELHYKWMGDCDSEGNIRVRLKVYNTDRDLHRHTVIRTLCHEVAHLASFDHSKEFKMLEQELIAWSKKQDFWDKAPQT